MHVIGVQDGEALGVQFNTLNSNRNCRMVKRLALSQARAGVMRQGAVRRRGRPRWTGSAAAGRLDGPLPQQVDAHGQQDGAAGGGQHSSSGVRSDSRSACRPGSPACSPVPAPPACPRGAGRPPWPARPAAWSTRPAAPTRQKHQGDGRHRRPHHVVGGPVPCQAGGSGGKGGHGPCQVEEPASGGAPPAAGAVPGRRWPGPRSRAPSRPGCPASGGRNRAAGPSASPRTGSPRPDAGAR